MIDFRNIKAESISMEPLRIEVEALAPLSLCIAQPGKYYASNGIPTEGMLYGMFENALGIHLPDEDRKKMIRSLNLEAGASQSGFSSVLKHLVKVVRLREPFITQRYDDLWCQLLRGDAFWTGSREHSSDAISILNASKDKKISIKDKAGFNKEHGIVRDFSDGEEVHIKALRPFFPEYYPTPTPREYVVWDGVLGIELQVFSELKEELCEKLESPSAPLYLGSNDGWVDVNVLRN